MPELPEVETIKLGLQQLIIGKTIKSVVSDNQKSFPNAEIEVNDFLIGATITEIHRRAKVLIINLSSDYSLVIHLKMTGQLVFIPSTNYQLPTTSETRFAGGHPTDSLINKLPDKSTRVNIEFLDGSRLFFNDQRKFGWMRLLPTLEVPNIDFMRKVGPEPLDSNFTATDFVQRLMRRSKSTIKSVLLDQTVVAGVGNIYADESLYASKIHPSSRVQDIPIRKLRQLFRDLQAILQLSIDSGGSTDRNYVDAQGNKGSYLTFAKVFRRQGQACPRCGSTIVKLRVAGRGTHICPTCQQL